MYVGHIPSLIDADLPPVTPRSQVKYSDRDLEELKREREAVVENVYAPLHIVCVHCDCACPFFPLQCNNAQKECQLYMYICSTVLVKLPIPQSLYVSIYMIMSGVQLRAEGAILQTECTRLLDDKSVLAQRNAELEKMFVEYTDTIETLMGM